jgi:hypothetical protein
MFWRRGRRVTDNELACAEHVIDDRIGELFDRYGRALSRGDLQGIASCWDVPALMLADDEVVALEDTSQVEAFFADVLQWYESNGLMATTSEVLEAVALSAQLALIYVRWPAFDDSGLEIFSETSYYILRERDGRHWKIQIGITETRRPERRQLTPE